MKALTVHTNNIPRLLLDFNQLPAKVQTDFDYHDPADGGDFVCYKGVYYHVNEFERASGALSEWDSMHAEAYFSGVLCRFIDDDHVIMGTFFC